MPFATIRRRSPSSKIRTPFSSPDRGTSAARFDPAPHLSPTKPTHAKPPTVLQKSRRLIARRTSFPQRRAPLDRGSVDRGRDRAEPSDHGRRLSQGGGRMSAKAILGAICITAVSFGLGWAACVWRFGPPRPGGPPPLPSEEI